MDAWLFPGQGAQRPGMGAPWVGTPAWAVVDRVSDAAGRDVGALLLDADAETLQATRNAQLATFTLSLVALAAWRDRTGDAALEAAAFAGHSLGEYTALVAAGALSEEGGTRLVLERGEAMQDAADAALGTMAALLGLDAAVVAGLVGEVDGCWVANDNAPGQVVVSGTPAGVAAAGEVVRAAGGKVMALPVGGAFHSPLMAPAATRLEAALAAASFADARVPVVANVDATAHTEGAGWPARLSAQLSEPVRWRASLHTLAGLGIDRFVELGPGSALAGMVKRTVPAAARASVATPADLASTLAAGSG
jgi:[acyl-carrier-protein] S-malonyltransferase